MKTTAVWVSRDDGKDYVKIWFKEPTWVEPNNVWTGKNYLGISCVEKYPGPTIMCGEKMLVSIMIMEIV